MLLRARAALKGLHVEDDLDYNMGLDILREALGAPCEMIAENAGHDGAVVAHRVLREKKASWGFDALKGEYCDMIELQTLCTVCHQSKTEADRQRESLVR